MEKQNCKNKTQQQISNGCGGCRKKPQQGSCQNSRRPMPENTDEFCN